MHLDVGFIATAVVRSWASRRDNAWAGLVATPLALTATGVLGQWWAWPILVGDAAFLTRAWRASWALSLLLGFVGTAWAVDGAVWLATAGDKLLVVGGVWATMPLLFAGAAWENRQRHDGDELRPRW
ncbi:MAG: hypothetical protein ACLP36_16900 [Acidimicrobiales bacterium]